MTLAESLHHAEARLRAASIDNARLEAVATDEEAKQLEEQMALAMVAATFRSPPAT